MAKINITIEADGDGPGCRVTGAFPEARIPSLLRLLADMIEEDNKKGQTNGTSKVGE